MRTVRETMNHCTSKLDKVHELDKLLEIQNLPRENCDEIVNSNKPITSKELNQ
jgi:hypothetical protein